MKWADLVVRNGRIEDCKGVHIRTSLRSRRGLRRRAGFAYLFTHREPSGVPHIENVNRVGLLVCLEDHSVRLEDELAEILL